MIWLLRQIVLVASLLWKKWTYMRIPWKLRPALRMTAICQLPFQPQPLVAGRQLTTDLPYCTDSEFPIFPWDELESILQSTEEQANPLDRGAGPSGATRTGSPIIRHCGQLQPHLDTPLSPPVLERGPSYSTNVTDQQLHKLPPPPKFTYSRGQC